MDSDATSDAHRNSRRDLLKKAGVGAAIVWAAPVVSSAVTPAAAQTGGPPPPTECTDTFLVKYDNSTCDGGTFVYVNQDGSCSAAPTATLVPNGQDACDISTGTSADGDGCQVSVTLPSDATNIVAYVFQAGGCVSGTSGDLTVTNPGNSKEQGASVSISGNVVTFTKIDDWSHVNVSFCSPSCVAAVDVD